MLADELVQAMARPFLVEGDIQGYFFAETMAPRKFTEFAAERMAAPALP